MITDFLFGGVLSAVVAVDIGAAFAWFWYGRPLLRLRD
jgi:HAMP domain-containing protein